MVYLLKSAQLTMNFDTNFWFEKENTFNTYANCFERAVDI